MGDITNALKVPGWMWQHELQWLADQATRYSKIVEIGSWRGRSTRALADNTPGTVTAVDGFVGSPFDTELSGGNFADGDGDRIFPFRHRAQPGFKSALCLVR